MRREHDHKTRPVAKQESQTWLTSLEAVSAARAVCPEIHFVSVGDREAAGYDLFLVERPVGVDLLWYAVRWGIEVWHKILKSGCQIEQKQLGTAYRLTTCLTLYSVIVWRILYATIAKPAAAEP